MDDIPHGKGSVCKGHTWDPSAAAAAFASLPVRRLFRMVLEQQGRQPDGGSSRFRRCTGESLLRNGHSMGGHSMGAAVGSAAKAGCAVGAPLGACVGSPDGLTDGSVVGLGSQASAGCCGCFRLHSRRKQSLA